MGNRYLVTGGAGFLGVNLARYLLEGGHSVTSLDIINVEHADLAGRVRALRGDIRDQAAVDRAIGCGWTSDGSGES